MYFSFTGRDGNGTYAREKQKPNTFYPIDDNPIKVPFSGDVITYVQNWVILAGGFALGMELPAGFSIDLSFQISPLIMCGAIDNHLTTKFEFRDYPRWGLFFEPEGKLSYRIKRFEFSYIFAYRKIINSKGETYYREHGKDIFLLSSTEGGAGLSVINSSFVAALRF